MCTSKAKTRPSAKNIHHLVLKKRRNYDYEIKVSAQIEDILSYLAYLNFRTFTFNLDSKYVVRCKHFKLLAQFTFLTR